MGNATPSPALIRFGVFEADLRSGELRKNGLKLRLQEQPFQILAMLLERPGEVVSREELRQRLWSDDTFVDFDHGLNTAIKKLRDALGDDATNPRFVETLARRGYRFIAPVQTTAATAATQGGAPEVSSNPAMGAADDGALAALPPVATELPQPARGVTRGLFALIQVMYLVFYGVALWRLDDVRALAGLWLGSGVAVAAVVLVSAAAGIALRLYLLAAAAFDYRALGRSFRRLFPVVLPLDQLWALAPFLLLGQIGLGPAFAACAALLYLPFSERTLIRMAYEY